MSATIFLFLTVLGAAICAVTVLLAFRIGKDEGEQGLAHTARTMARQLHHATADLRAAMRAYRKGNRS